MGKGRDRDAAPRTDEQRAVARIVEFRQAGESYQAIAATLDVEDHRPLWSPSPQVKPVSRPPFEPKR